MFKEEKFMKKTKLFVAGIDYSVTESQLKQFFESKIGTVLSVKIIVDRMTNQSKGFGFVEMETEEDARKAINSLNNTAFNNRDITVKEAKPKVNNI